MTAVIERLSGRFERVFFCPDTIRTELAAAFPESVIHEIPAVKFVMYNFEIDYVRTTFENIQTILSAGNIIGALVNLLREERIMGLISDFEPFVPEAASRLFLPIVQLNHPGVVTRVGGMAPEAFLSRVVAARMMSKFDREIICSFYEGDVGPIIRSEIARLLPLRSVGDYFVVYAKDSFRESLRESLKTCHKTDFRFFPDPSADYLAALAGCRGIIASAGHQIICEALFLGKPIFVIPVKNQYEQRLNAEMLKKSGRGTYGLPDSYREELLAFLRGIDEYPKRPGSGIRFRFADDGDTAARKISAFLEKSAGRRDRRLFYQRISIGRILRIA